MPKNQEKRYILQFLVNKYDTSYFNIFNILKKESIFTLDEKKSLRSLHQKFQLNFKKIKSKTNTSTIKNPSPII